MISKLDYLKKYLAKPGGGPQACQKHSKIEKKKKRSRPPGEPAALHILDISEVLPKPRGDDVSKVLPQDDAVFVDEQAVARAQKVEVETSGVRWRIQQHQRSHTSSSRAGAEKPSSMVKEERPIEGEPDLSSTRTLPLRGTCNSSWPAKVQQQATTNNLSPPPAARRDDVESDLSPPRRLGRSADGARSHENSEARVKAEADSEEDISPPRRRVQHSSDADMSAPRRLNQHRHDSDVECPLPQQSADRKSQHVQVETREKQAIQESVVKKTQRHDSDVDLSPRRLEKRQRHDSDVDLSPRRQTAGDIPESARMSSGLRAGLLRGSELKDEAAQVRAERRAAVLGAPDEETGKGAGTVHRDKNGKKITREEWIEMRQKKRRKRLSDYPEQELEWGGGVKQQYNKEEDLAEVERIAAQPFARFEPDEKYMEELRERQDWNDPMRRYQEAKAEGTGGVAGLIESQSTKKPKCPHPPWPNRFNILPGYRWDGKVRGENFERRWLETKNQREFQKKEQWKYEMEEM